MTSNTQRTTRRQRPPRTLPPTELTDADRTEREDPPATPSLTAAAANSDVAFRIWVAADAAQLLAFVLDDAELDWRQLRTTGAESSATIDTTTDQVTAALTALRQRLGSHLTHIHWLTGRPPTEDEPQTQD